jgi:large subunit ribosomal protein L25
MSTTDTIPAISRVAGKKGHARRLRASGRIPAVAYGPSSAPQSLALDPKQFVKARRHYGPSHIYNVEVEGGPAFKALVKSVAIDPRTRAYQHVDLYAIDMARAIRVEVRIELTGKPKGLLNGGLLQQIRHAIEVQCLPALIPERIELDVSGMDVGHSLHLSDLKLPEGVRSTALDNQTVAIVAAPEAEETPAAAAAVADGAPAETAEAEKAKTE